MFVTAHRSIYALNAKNGETIWTYVSPRQSSDHDRRDHLGASSAAPNFRGVAVGHGLVFAGLQDGHVIALNERTGDFVWIHQTGLTDPKQGQSASPAPTYADGIVFAGLSNGDANLRGRVTAIDAATGKRLWQFFTVPAPGDAGHETWPADSNIWKLGGGGVWTNVAVDRQLGIAYVTTGNAVPAFAGDLRPGDNLFTCSLLAIDIKTGRLRWHYQLVRHDVFDADAGTPAIIYETKIDGRLRKAIAVLRADGYLFQFDRETGEPLMPMHDRDVPQLASQRTAATQPFPETGDSILMSCEDWKKAGLPEGFTLGCMWTPPFSPTPSSEPQNVLAPFPSVRVGAMAYSPDTGYFYAHGTSFLAWARRSQDPYYLTFDTTVLNIPSYGLLAAIDSRTGRLAWTRSVLTAKGGLPFQRGSLLATAGGLVFRSSVDGNVEAYDASTGHVLWTFQTAAENLEGAPMSYAIDGEQYIALSIGSAVMALKLGGKASDVPPRKLTSTVQERFVGPVTEADEIETTTFHQSRFGSGTRYFVDEYTFNPHRARVKAGTTVLFVNNGSLRHEIVSIDDSWGTGPLGPAEEAWVTFTKAGSQTYICREHPWSYGQILIEQDTTTSLSTASATGTNSELITNATTDQLTLGKNQFFKNCGACHGEDLLGRSPAPALSGPTFTSRWANIPMTQLVNRIRTTMPPGNPDSLPQSAYDNIATYLLYSNGLNVTDSDEGPASAEHSETPR